MKSFFDMFRTSAKEFTNIRSLVITGLFIAVSAVLEMFSINVTAYLKINFAFLAIAVIGMLFGPTMGLAAGMICDVVGIMVSPVAAFLPAYTLVAGLQGVIYGCWLYTKAGFEPLMKSSDGGRSFDYSLLIRAAAARLCDVLVINLLLNTYLNMHYGFIPAESFRAAVVARVLKNAFELAADLPLLFIILPASLAAYKQLSAHRKHTSDGEV